MDRSPSVSAGNIRSAGAVREGMEEYGLVEVWRHRHPTAREYSFHSQVHDSFFRIDLVLLSSSLLCRVEVCLYLPHSISDHSPLKVVMDLPEVLPPDHRWRLNPGYLASEEFVAMVGSQIDEYLVHNDPSSSTLDFVWEALKATLQGYIISHSVAYKKKCCARVLDLELELRQAETEDYKNCSAKSRERVVRIRHDLNMISASKAENALLRTRSRYYARGDKAGKLLAWQLWKAELERHIAGICVPESDPSGDSKVTNKEFASYYSSRYSSESNFQRSRDCMSQFLDTLPIPVLAEEDKSHIDQLISTEEIIAAIGELQSGSLPRTLRQALITVLPKQGKDPTLCSLYHPISLLNVDFKILAKILVHRMEIHLPGLIHPDQTGYILHRHSTDNVRRLLNIIHYSGLSGDDRVAVSLDVEKAFDCVEWDYLLEISYYAAADELSDRLKFPSFFRTVPHGKYQSISFTKLLLHFGWTWVGFLVEGTDYGELTTQSLKAELAKTNVCIGFLETIPTVYSARRINHIVDVIKKSSVSVIMIICFEAYLIPLMEEVSRQNVTGKTWVTSASSSTSKDLFKTHRARTLTGTIGFALYKSDIPGFRDFLLNLHPFTTQHNLYIDIFWEDTFGCKWPHTYQAMATNKLSKDVKLCTGTENLQELNISFLDVSQSRATYCVYNAVYAAAHALHELYMCRPGGGPFFNGTCANVHDFEPWQLLHYIKNVHFKNKLGDHIYFDDDGNGLPVFDILNWQLTPDGIFKYVDVGRIDFRSPPGKELIINSSALMWNGGQVQVPRSVCSESCPPGYRKVVRQEEPVCCFDCILCSEGEISNQTDSIECMECPHNHYSNGRRDECIPKSIEFLSYKEPLGAILASISILSSLIPSAILCTFVRHHDTPIVKANNRELSYFLLLALVLCFLCCLIFIGQPVLATCMLRQTAFGVIFAFSVSCVLAKTIMVVIAFNATKPNSNLKKWVGHKLSNTIVFVCTLLQVIICTVWLASSPPFPEQNMKSETRKIIIQCNAGSTLAFWFMLGYMGMLAIISFIVAFLARNLPDSFNEAKFITFSMLVFVCVWLSFIPAYLSTKGKYMVAVEIFAILASSTGLLGCIFFPKVYIIVLRPEMNTREFLMGKGTFTNKK
nr:PREDICTED: vomeronasal type-2 receptor 1-like [Latimeria chalumnae]|eukprot:XP_014353273.1 PREDICTED: vomeronasal type-2 receptor 1-like [Latimeria chalumnae]